MLENQILPALAELARQQEQQQQQQQLGPPPAGQIAPPAGPAGASAGQAANAALLLKYPNGLGLTDGQREGSGGGPMDLAATVLRMLYIKDLRGLQTAIDAAIVHVSQMVGLMMLVCWGSCWLCRSW